MNKIRIFSYLPNPRVWKSIITAKIGGIDLEVIGDKPNNMPNWLWDFDAKPITDEDKSKLKSFEIKSKRGFKGSLYKTNEFMGQHPFGTVPAGLAFGGGPPVQADTEEWYGEGIVTEKISSS